jgi:hypothetical protein
MQRTRAYGENFHQSYHIEKDGKSAPGLLAEVSFPWPGLAWSVLASLLFAPRERGSQNLPASLLSWNGKRLVKKASLVNSIDERSVCRRRGPVTEMSRSRRRRREEEEEEEKRKKKEKKKKQRTQAPTNKSLSSNPHLARAGSLTPAVTSRFARLVFPHMFRPRSPSDRKIGNSTHGTEASFCHAGGGG